MVQRSKDEKGQALVVIAIMMVAFVGMLGLIIDGGTLLAERRSLQNAADAAATAAAVDLAQGNSAATATTSALYYAAQNGYNNDQTNNWVTVSIPPASGGWAGNGNFAQVAIKRKLNTFFVQVVYSGVSAASASATAGITTAPAPYSILVLNRTACNSLLIDNNGTIGDAADNPKGSIMVDSSCASAMNVNNNGNVWASSIGVVGNYVKGNNAYLSVTPQAGSPYVPDPLANLPPPDLNSLPVQNGDPYNPSTLTILNNKTMTLQPGVYYGGIKTSNNVTLNLQPGVYIMAGGGFNTSNNSIVNGTGGVFIYNTWDPKNHGPGPGAYGSIAFDNNSTINLKPLSSGPYKGLMFFQDRNNTMPFNVSNNGSSTGGTLYFPSAACNLSNNAAAYIQAQMICDNLHVSNNAFIDNEYKPDGLYAVPNASLVE